MRTGPPSYATLGDIVASPPPKLSSQDFSRMLNESLRVRRTSDLTRTKDEALLQVEMTNVRGVTIVHPSASLVFQPGSVTLAAASSATPTRHWGRAARALTRAPGGA